MSLRKSPQLTAPLLDAARRNGRHSTGARTVAGKQSCKFNALKHGERSDPENHYDVMRALGEDPAEFEALQQELRDSFGLGDALVERQIDDLARLYWRRQRLERAQEGVMRRALLAVEEWQQRRRQQLAGASFDAPGALASPLAPPADLGVRLRLLLSYLQVIREQVKQGVFTLRHVKALQGPYHGRFGWRQVRLCNLLLAFGERAEPRKKAYWEEVLDELKQDSMEEEAEEGEEAEGAEPEGPGEAEYQELLRLLEEEIASVQEEFEYEEALQEQKAAIEREACLAPAGEQWKMMLRREETLDRSIDRKIKLLLSLRKEAAKSPKPESLESSCAPPGEEDLGPPVVSAEDVGAPLEGDQAGEACSHQGRPKNEQPSPLESV